jgi:hypothetical protein
MKRLLFSTKRNTNKKSCDINIFDESVSLATWWAELSRLFIVWRAHRFPIILVLCIVYIYGRAIVSRWVIVSRYRMRQYNFNVITQPEIVCQKAHSRSYSHERWLCIRDCYFVKHIYLTFQGPYSRK